MTRAKVVILAGGQGMRLREETEYRPKPMVEVGGKPLIWHIMKHYAHHGFKDFVVCLGYKGDMVKQYFLNYDFLAGDFTLTLGFRESVAIHGERDEYGWNITFANTGLEAETGSRLKQVEPYAADAELVLMTYGDGVADVDLGRLVEFHCRHGRAATVTGVSPPSRFGELLVESGRVVAFNEKPRDSTRLINGGFFVFDRRVFDYVTVDPACSFEREPLERLAAEGQLMTFEHQGFWHCVDTMRDLDSLNGLWKAGKASWATWLDAPTEVDRGNSIAKRGPRRGEEEAPERL